MKQARPLSRGAGAGGRSFHGWRWQLFKAGAVVVPSMAGAMMKQARPLSGGTGAGGRPSMVDAMMKQARQKTFSRWGASTRETNTIFASTTALQGIKKTFLSLFCALYFERRI